MSEKKVTLNAVDRLVTYFSPEEGFRRLQFRRAMEATRKYEAATAGRRGAGFTGSGLSANSEIGPALHRVRDRVRELVRNNPHAGRAVGLLEGYVIGTGVESVINAGGGKKQEKLRALWREWCSSLDADVDGLNTFYGLQALAVRSMAEGGECLIVRRWRKMSDGYRIPVPFQIQVLESDYLDTNKNDTLADGNVIRQGVEFNKSSRRVAYWLFQEHPGEKMVFSFKNNLVSVRVDAADVIHLFRVDRTGQIRGISWGAPCVIRHKDLDQFEDAQLVRQQIASCFAAFIKDIEVPDTIVKRDRDFPTEISSGMIEILPSGKDIVFPNLPGVTNDGHQERVLRSIAMGWGITYEALTGDFGGVNYSSYRGAMLDLKRNIAKWQWNVVIPRVCGGVFHWFKEAALLVGADSSEAYTEWTVPKFEMLDPTKEIPATVTAIRSGLQSLPEAVREQGLEFDKHLRDIKKSNDALDALGIILDSDPRKVMKAGIMQAPVADELSPPPKDDGETTQKK